MLRAPGESLISGETNDSHPSDEAGGLVSKDRLQATATDSPATCPCEDFLPSPENEFSRSAQEDSFLPNQQASGSLDPRTPVKGDNGSRAPSKPTEAAPTKRVSPQQFHQKARKQKLMKKRNELRKQSKAGSANSRETPSQEDATRQEEPSGPSSVEAFSSSTTTPLDDEQPPFPEPMSSTPALAVRGDNGQQRMPDLTMRTAATEWPGVKSQTPISQGTPSRRAVPRITAPIIPLRRLPSLKAESRQIAPVVVHQLPKGDSDPAEKLVQVPSLQAGRPASHAEEGKLAAGNYTKTSRIHAEIPVRSRPTVPTTDENPAAQTPSQHSTVVPAEACRVVGIASSTTPAGTPIRKGVVSAGSAQRVGCTTTPIARITRSARIPFSRPPEETLLRRYRRARACRTPKATRKRFVKDGYNLDERSRHVVCWKSGCGARCSLWDGSAYNCPGCGPFSAVHYCSEEHLLQDLQSHWFECGKYSFSQPCSSTSIPITMLNGPPLLPSFHHWDTLARRRQATYYNVCREYGDYFIFDGVNEACVLEAPLVEGVVSSPTVFKVVSISNNPEKKDQFRRALAACLFFALDLPELVGYLFRMIREILVEQNQWTPQVNMMLLRQFNLEMGRGSRLLPSISGGRHAAYPCHRGEVDDDFNNEWVARYGFMHQCDELEDSFWILRANRFTHPFVSDVGARSAGQGYYNVMPDDRRRFRSGQWVGWSGYWLHGV
ncbi:hypothetical protein N7468_006857 [Penicillium chermesinum]|uniref:Uncharacterized protein n=1 Tax=Penicillium chermesinum TaxID=63820 RepID=A0A9W9TJZ8_9EURO|nr:uncharacterized protein N7468_006857 [Penicillium chermesinum]KAJ5225632.1 hypothetical protein N7468_006857 [Penicillium chermesinum]